MMAQEVEIKQFGVADAQIPFNVYDERFYIYGDVPLTLIDSIAKWQEKGVAHTLQTGGLDTLLTLMAEFLLPESYTRFKRNVDEKKIGLRVLLELLPWILEQYGLRPTQPSSPSLDGSADGETGISLMDGAQLEESIPSS